MSSSEDEQISFASNPLILHFNFIRSAPIFKQPIVRQLQDSISCNVDKFARILDDIRSRNEVVDKVISFHSHIQRCCQIPQGSFRSSVVLPNSNFAAVLPGDSVAGLVVANGLSNFLNIYNTLLVARLVLTWFPNAPPVIVSPLSTICDPYLNIFRGLIPPLGGLDLSPVLAFLVLNAFTSTASALPAELPLTEVSKSTPSQKKWMRRVAGNKSKTSNGEI